MHFSGWPNPNGNADVQIFRQTATTNNNTQWITFQKPPGKSMLHVFVLGGGGGGGSGFSGIAGAPRGGGGSGGGSASSTLTIPWVFLPDTLYIQVGCGGSGGNVSNGGSGIVSYVSIAPNNTGTNVLAASGSAAPSGGVQGSASAGGTAGGAGVSAAITNMWLAAQSHYMLNGGQVGVAGGAHTGAIGTAQVLVIAARCGAGSGGAGVTAADFAGGAFTAITDVWLSDNRPATPAAGSFNGSGGRQIWKPFFSFGGGGGSSSNTGLGGHGGHGALGAGGGGGGGGTTGGRGGDGGDGIILVTSW